MDKIVQLRKKVDAIDDQILAPLVSERKSAEKLVALKKTRVYS